MSNALSAMNLKFSKKEKIALIGLSALLIGEKERPLLRRK